MRQLLNFVYPMGFYSCIHALSALTKGYGGIPNDPSNEGGFIVTMAYQVKSSGIIGDSANIIENLNLQIKTLDAAQLPRFVEADLLH